MAKKLFKFIKDPAAKAGDGKDANGAPNAEDLNLMDEAAALYPETPVDDPIATAMQSEIAEGLDAAEESAAKFSKTASGVDIESFEAAEANYLKILAEQTGLRVVDLSQHERPSNELLHLLTADQAKHLNAIPVEELEDGIVVIALSDPSNPMITDDLRAIIDREIEPVIADDGEIRERISSYYGMGDESMEDVVAQVDVVEESHTAESGTAEIDLSDPTAIANAPPVIKLVNLLLIKAIKERASDIHIEPFPNLLRIRYRVDGLLREIPSPPRNMLAGLVSRIKVLADMNISESRMPQDGRIKLMLEGREVDLRVSTVPTVHGEAIVMRVLDKSMMMVGISQIGMGEEMLDRFMHHVRKPNGVVLVTGPTGCGKTTTLYSAINEIKDPGDKLITVEDPIEYEMNGIVQVNINDTVGLTFARCLRAILRQDPDTVLVGEVRDIETAQISIQASLTGHLVFSTLHTNSAAATITRLIDMGVEPFLITASLEAVIGQRLVRTICRNCRATYRPTEEDMLEFGLTDEKLQDQDFYYGEGCPECGHTGYRGRMGLFELMEIDDEMRELILDQATTDEVQELAQRHGMATMRMDGWTKICLGLTTFEEVARETPRDTIEIDGAPSYEEPADGEEKEGEKTASEDKEPAKIDKKTMMIEGESAAVVDDRARSPKADRA